MLDLPSLRAALAPYGAADGVSRADVAGHALGTPVLTVRPRSTDDVVAILTAARRHRVAVVPVGHTTAYWHPLDLHGVVALDTTRLDALRLDDGVLHAGAGAEVRTADEHLRAHGRHLPLHPDAFGETSVGAMVATACTSGVGMAQGPISRHLTGLTVVVPNGPDGSATVLRTGAGGAWPHLPTFQRDGVPDLTGLFLAAEGTLGVITEVSLRAPPAPWRARLSLRAPVDAGLRLVDIGTDLCERELVDTFRAVREAERVPATGWSVDVFVRSPVSEDELRTRVSHVVTRLVAAGLPSPSITLDDDAARAGRGPGYDARWAGPRHGHAAFAARATLVGMDVNAPRALAADVLAIADAVQAEQLGRGVLQSRTALYLAPDFVNVGLHAAVPRDDVWTAWAHAHVTTWLGRLATLPVVPYRIGRTWPRATVDALSPALCNTLAQVALHLDPDGVMHPGHPAWGRRSS